MNYCPECGARITDNSKYCSECGTHLTSKQNTFKNNYTPKGTLPFKYKGIELDLREILINNNYMEISSIKELRDITGLGLADSKKVIESALKGQIYQPREEYYAYDDSNTSNYDYQGYKEKNKSGCLNIFLWIVFFPIMIIIFVIKSDKLTTLQKVIIVIMLIATFSAISKVS